MNYLKIGILSLTITFFSCGGEEKSAEPTTQSETMYQVDPESVVLNWTAYKTTDKVPVGGKFGKINVNEFALSDNMQGAIDNVSFSVPISSLFTNNDDRDWKLKNLFFGIMDQTEFITGTFHAKEGNSTEGKGVMDLTMNNKTCDLPYDYTIANDSMHIITHLNILEWNAQEAMDSLNKACYDLHKGADGISKTWSEVEIKASVAIVAK